MSRYVLFDALRQRLVRSGKRLIDEEYDLRWLTFDDGRHQINERLVVRFQRTGGKPQAVSEWNRKSGVVLQSQLPRGWANRLEARTINCTLWLQELHRKMSAWVIR